MENLQIEGTATLPSVFMSTEGRIKLEGRALPEDAVRFFKPILAWAGEFHGKSIVVEINLEYFNTSVSKQLHDFLNVLDAKPNDCEVQVIWFFEEGDDEMLESGEIYQELFPRIKFSYKEYEEIVD